MTETMADQAAPDPEEQFPPRPGGLVDTARKEKARLEAAFHVQSQAEADKTAAAPRKARPVTVKIRQADLFGAKTMTLAAGASALAMPADPNRTTGLVNLITPSSSVTVARDRASADTGTGFLLQSVMLYVMPISHTREVWLNNPGSGPVQVSVYTESYADEPC